MQADERVLRDGRRLLRLEIFPQAGEPEHFALYFDQESLADFLDGIHVLRREWREGKLVSESGDNC